MDVQGIDQVMIIPTDIDTYPWLLDAVGAKAFCKAYNQWAYEYTRADPDRLFFAALLPMQNAQFAVQEVYRVAAQGCRVALVRPTDAMGNYPLQPKYEPVWNALEETGMVYGMHPFPAGGALKPAGYSEQYSGAELIRRTISASGIPHSFLTNVQNFQSEASLWVTTALAVRRFAGSCRHCPALGSSLKPSNQMNKGVSATTNPRAVQGLLDATVAGLDDIGRHGTDKGVECLRADRIHHALSDLLRIKTRGGEAFRQHGFVIGTDCGPPMLVRAIARATSYIRVDRTWA